jgi:hypothetical protein
MALRAVEKRHIARSKLPMFVLPSQPRGGFYVMTTRIVSAEDGKHLKRLYEQHALAAMRASALLGREGTESAKFKEAIKRQGELGVTSG